MKKHPIQPVGKDDKGVVRFKPNKIVQYLLDNGGIDLNDLARKDFTADDRMQFAQLIGYSLSGFGELSYTDDETYSAAEIMSRSNITVAEARAQHNADMLTMLRTALRVPMSELYGIHPDDLGNTGWNGNQASRDERQEPIEIDDDMEPPSPKRDCPWKCKPGTVDCICERAALAQGTSP